MLTLGEIASLLSAPLLSTGPGDSARSISGLNTIADAKPTEITFLGADYYSRQLAGSHAAAVIVQKNVKVPAGLHMPSIRVDDADLAVSKLLSHFAPPVPRPPVGIDSTARVGKDTTIGNGAAVGAYVVIGSRCKLGSNCCIHPGVYIGDDVVIGDDCQLFSAVVIRERITLGNRVTIHAGSVLGTDGFGYRWDGTKIQKVPQIGTVVIEDEVEIGSCVCIDRAKFSETRIGHGTKIDNLVQIAHNVIVGAHCVITGQAGLAGSARLGNGVVMGGASGVRDHRTVGDGARIAASSGVMDDVDAGTMVSGTPAIIHRQSLREQAALRRLPELVQQVRKLQEQIARLTPTEPPQK
jgi:UDP-3-O-[3-hydroxymyristoyl] glucosamine N-acyltransferase